MLADCFMIGVFKDLLLDHSWAVEAKGRCVCFSQHGLMAQNGLPCHSRILANGRMNKGSNLHPRQMTKIKPNPNFFFSSHPKSKYYCRYLLRSYLCPLTKSSSKLVAGSLSLGDCSKPPAPRGRLRSSAESWRGWVKKAPPLWWRQGRCVGFKWPWRYDSLRNKGSIRKALDHMLGLMRMG